MSPETAAPPRRRRASRLPLLAGIVIVAAGAVFAWRSLPGKTPEPTGLDPASDKTWTVERGEFRITILLDGTLDAIKRHDLRCEVRRGDKRIIYAVEDRSEVEKGEVIIRLDPQKLLDEEDRLEDEIDTARLELQVLREDLKVTQSDNVSKIKTAADDLRTTNENREKYFELDAPDKQDDLRAKIDAAEEALAEAQSDLTAIRDESATVNRQDPEEIAAYEKKLKAAEETVLERETALEKARNEYDIFRRYDHPRKERELERALSSKEMNLRNVLMRAATDVVQTERKILRKERQLQRLENELQQVREDLGNIEIKAPVAGIVTLGNPYRRRWQQPKEFKVGTTLNTNEVVASIPDLSRFLVEIDLPEEFRSRVRVGMPAVFKSPALPELVMRGKVKDIASMASNVIAWDTSSPKIYKTTITADAADERLTPGMSVNVEVIAEEVRDVLYVPVEALYQREGQVYCQKDTSSGPAETPVKAGRSSVHYVEILEGLAEGEHVLLFQAAGVGGGAGADGD
jgi:HlyD family secretion protein